MQYVKMWVDENGTLQMLEEEVEETYVEQKASHERYQFVKYGKKLTEQEEKEIEEQERLEREQREREREEARKQLLESEPWVFSYTQEEWEADLDRYDLDEYEKETLLCMMMKLSSRERAMMVMKIGFFGRERTVEEVALAFDTTKEMVHYVEQKCIKILIKRRHNRLQRRKWKYFD